MAENQIPSFADSVRVARERLGMELRAQAEHILKLSQELAALQLLHGRTEQEAARQWDEVEGAAARATTAIEAANAATAEATASAAAAAAAAAAEPKVSPDAALENVLAGVRGLMTCTIPEQLFEVLTEEASQWGVRAAIFDVRGKAAWGASAHGFGPALTDRVMRSLIVQLSQDNPFRQVCESGGPVEASVETLRKNRNVLDKLKPALGAPILLLPVRSAGSVAAIFYADPGDAGHPLPENGLKILAEFAGAQIDRLIALSGGFSDGEAAQGVLEAAESDAPVEEAVVEAPPAVVAVEEVAPAQPAESAPVEVPVEHTVPAETPAADAPVTEAVPAEPPAIEAHAAESPVAEAAVTPPVEAPAETAPAEPPTAEAVLPEPLAETPAATPEPAAPELPTEPAPPVIEPPAEMAPPAAEIAPVEVLPVEPVAVEPPAPVMESAPAPMPEAAAEIAPPPPPPVPSEPEVTQLSEAEQKVHKDAKRFARILVSEIELYNKTKVTDGRKNRDLYKRLKSDIDRSRQTFDKRFGKVLSKQYDYFHEELVKSLAMNDPALLGPEYPGSSA